MRRCVGLPFVFFLCLCCCFPISILAKKQIKVAIIDSGINLHRFQEQVVGGYDYVSNLPVYQMTDPDGHGTKVASIIHDVAPDARFLVYRVLNEKGYTKSMNRVLKAIHQAQEDGADIINLSLGYDRSPVGPLIDAVNEAVRKGVVVVAAAGNEGECGVNAPGTSADVITVGAAKEVGLTGLSHMEVARFSSRGPIMNTFAIKPDIVAPGKRLPLRYGKTFTGTSAAAPYVSGVVALLKEAHPHWTPKQIKAALSNTAKPIMNQAGERMDCFAQGAGLVQPDEAKQTESFVYPTSMSFGYIKKESTSHTKIRFLTIENQSSVPKTYQIQTVWDRANQGAEVSVTNQVTVPAGRSVRVQVKCIIDATAANHYAGAIELRENAHQFRVPFAFSVEDPPLGVELEVFDDEEQVESPSKKQRLDNSSTSFLEEVSIKPSHFLIHLYLPTAVERLYVSAVRRTPSGPEVYPVLSKDDGFPGGVHQLKWDGTAQYGYVGVPDGEYNLCGYVVRGGITKGTCSSRFTISHTAPRITWVSVTPGKNPTKRLEGMVEHLTAHVYELWWKKASEENWHRTKLRKVKKGKYRFYLSQKDGIEWGEGIDLKAVDERRNERIKRVRLPIQTN